MLLLLTGEFGAGKTILCVRLVNAFKAQSIDVAGVLTLPRFANGEKIGMDVMDARTGETHALAERATVERRTGGLRWQFDDGGLAFGECALRNAIPCAVLIIDELGPLELLRGEGWTIGIDALQSRRYQYALVVVRPSLLANLQSRLTGIDLKTLIVTSSNRDELYEQLIAL